MGRCVGSRHHAAKITEADVRAIREERAKGKTIDAIHQQFSELGLTHSSIEKIVYGLSWKHV